MELTQGGFEFATFLVAAPARSTWARGQFGLKNKFQQLFVSELIVVRIEGAA
jgi:hypothetical protein